MSELESVCFCAPFCDGTKCSTATSQQNQEFDLGREPQINGLSNDSSNGLINDSRGDCSDGVCPTNWKPQRQEAA